ncbi:MAG: HipA domain-containing protein [Actinomycetota bacterium]|nr:HipA domain-containing protein [Actinomycetota bacterium]
MTSETQAYVWVWLPGSTEPVVAGVLTNTGGTFSGDPVLAFTYARSFRDRPDAVSLFAPELELRGGVIDPTAPAGSRFPLPLAGCLRDAAPDAWGRRVLNMELARNPDTDLDELTYLLHSGSNRIGALDFQSSPVDYVPRGEAATLTQLMQAADLIEQGRPIPADLAAAAGHGTSIGGARPKAILEDAGRHLIAKFSSSSDTRPVVKAEAVGMLLAAKVGIAVADVEVVRAVGKDVLLVERFDRPADGTRRIMLSALTILGLHENSARYASYTDIAHSIRTDGWGSVSATLREMFTRLVFNVCIGNNDDHLRNHAAFWDGKQLELTPAYDLCPQPRATSVSAQAIGITADERYSQLRVVRKAAGAFHLTNSEADEIIAGVVDTIRASWDDVRDQALLTTAEASQLWGREILNDFIFYDQA